MTPSGERYGACWSPSEPGVLHVNGGALGIVSVYHTDPLGTPNYYQQRPNEKRVVYSKQPKDKLTAEMMRYGHADFLKQVEAWWHAGHARTGVMGLPEAVVNAKVASTVAVASAKKAKKKPTTENVVDAVVDAENAERKMDDLVRSLTHQLETTTLDPEDDAFIGGGPVKSRTGTSFPWFGKKDEGPSGAGEPYEEEEGEAEEPEEGESDEDDTGFEQGELGRMPGELEEEEGEALLESDDEEE